MGLGKTYSADYLIDSNGNTGVSGQVLISTATGIDWADGTAITGGPYLPLAGGTITGSVGIGTTAPGRPLTVNSDAAHKAIRILENDTGNESWDIGVDVDGDLNFFNSADTSPSVTFRDDGKVGIGTTAPQSPLSVKSNSVSASNSGITLIANGSTDIIAAIGEKSTNGGRFHLYDGGTAKVSFYSDGTANYIAAGNVGIGTTNPTFLLHVQGTPPANNGALINARNSAATTTNTTFGGIFFNSSPGYDFSIGKSNVNSVTTLSFRNGNDGASLMDITPSGNVGIGTTSPSSANGFDAKLQLESANPMLVYKETDQTTKWEVGAWGGNYVVYNGTNERMRIDSAGNVGIGTTNPGAALQIGNGVGDKLLKIHGAATAGIQIFTGGGAGAKIAFLEQHFSNEGALGLKYDGTTKIHLRANGNSYFNGGNVGIGTTAPGAKLDVNSSSIWINPADGSHAGLHFRQGGTFLGFVGYNDGNNVVNLSMDGSIANGINVNASHNVGIGTASPAAKLDVVVSNVSVTPNGDSSGVFRKNGNNYISILSGATNEGGVIFGNSADAADGWIAYKHGTGAADQAFAFGTANGERMRITKDGNVGIGTTSPGYKLTVDNDDLDTNNPALYVKNPNSSTAAVIAEFVGDSDSIEIKNIGTGDYAIYNSQQDNGIALFDGTGGVEIKYAGTTTLESDSTGGIKVTGQLSATGDVVAYSSDERLKENIKPIESAVDKIKQLKGVTFDWNEKSEELGFEPTTKTNDVGVIAQDVEAVFPQLVQLAPFDIARGEDGNATSKSGEDYKTVNYARLTAVLIEAVKEQQQQIDELKKQIK